MEMWHPASIFQPVCLGCSALECYVRGGVGTIPANSIGELSMDAAPATVDNVVVSEPNSTHPTARVDLQVPFNARDDAKKLGAHWDTHREVWFVPAGVDPGPFGRWLPIEPKVNVRSSSYFIAQGSRPCLKCGKLTRVYAFLLPPSHEILIVDGEDEAKDAWDQYDIVASVDYAGYLLPSVAEQMKALSPHFRQDHVRSMAAPRWMNHCEHCGMKRNLEHLHGFGVAFSTLDEQQEQRIGLRHVAKPFACEGDICYCSCDWESMMRDATL